MIYESGIDVVVVNYRTPQLIKKFVDSYLFQSFKDTELIIVDVDPTEETEYELREILSRYTQLEFQYWPIYINCGYSRSMQLCF